MVRRQGSQAEQPRQTRRPRAPRRPPQPEVAHIDFLASIIPAEGAIAWSGKEDQGMTVKLDIPNEFLGEMMVVRQMGREDLWWRFHPMGALQAGATEEAQEEARQRVAALPIVEFQARVKAVENALSFHGQDNTLRLVLYIETDNIMPALRMTRLTMTVLEVRAQATPFQSTGRR